MTKASPTRFKVWKIGSRNFLGLLAVAIGLAGCSTTNSNTSNRTIAIESDPPGVRVEANGENPGPTPTTYTVRADRKRNFADGWGDPPSVVFTAFPPEGQPNLYRQVKSFSPSGLMDSGDRVPERIFFDMHNDIGH